MAIPTTGVVDYFRRQEAARYRVSGAPCATYYRLSRSKNIDPLYGQPLSPAALHPADAPYDFADAIEFPGVLEYVEYDNQDPSVREEGTEIRRTAFFAFAIWEWICAWTVDGVYDETIVPRLGDVILIHDDWWDVTKADRAGPILNTGEYTGYKLDLKYHSRYTPDRKVP